MWTLLDVQRHADVLLCVVRWSVHRSTKPFAVAEVSLIESAVFGGKHLRNEGGSKNGSGVQLRPWMLRRNRPSAVLQDDPFDPSRRLHQLCSVRKRSPPLAEATRSALRHPCNANSCFHIPGIGNPRDRRTIRIPSRRPFRPLLDPLGFLPARPLFALLPPQLGSLFCNFG